MQAKQPALDDLYQVIDRLPPHIVATIVLNGFAYGVTPEAVRSGLIAAVTFQGQSTWRCACCHRWVKRVNLPLACIVDGQFQFHAYCEQCERKYGSSLQAVMQRVEGYVVEGCRP